jgi:hypothetical protein
MHRMPTLVHVVWAATRVALAAEPVELAPSTPPFVPWVYAPHFTLAMGHPVSGTEQVRLFAVHGLFD